jgi:hypothetical protein
VGLFSWSTKAFLALEVDSVLPLAASSAKALRQPELASIKIERLKTPVNRSSLRGTKFNGLYIFDHLIERNCA